MAILGSSPLAGDLVRRQAVALRRHLQSRYRLLAGDEDVLLQGTVEDLQAHLASLPASAAAGTAPDEADLADRVLALFERRIAALLRERSCEAARQAVVSLSALASLAPPGGEDEDGVRRPAGNDDRALLQALVLQLATLPADDRALLLSDVGRRADDASPSPERPEGERQRLLRLKRRLTRSLATGLARPAGD